MVNKDFWYLMNIQILKQSMFFMFISNSNFFADSKARGKNRITEWGSHEGPERTIEQTERRDREEGTNASGVGQAFELCHPGVRWWFSS